MVEPNTKIRLVLTTCALPDEARALGRVLVEERLVACATLIPGAESGNHWGDERGEDKVESGSETLVLLKTTADLVDALQVRLHALHSYQTPEFLVLDVAGASQAYLDWVLKSCAR